MLTSEKKLGPLQNFVGKEQKTKRYKDTRLTGVSLQEQFIEYRTDWTNVSVVESPNFSISQASVYKVLISFCRVEVYKLFAT